MQHLHFNLFIMNYAVCIGFDGQEPQEEFQGSLDACKGYAYAMKDFQHISTIHIVGITKDQQWSEDLAVMLDQELKPSLIEGYDNILVIV